MLAGTERSPSNPAAAEPSKNGASAGPARTLAAHAAELGALLARLARVRAARFGLWLTSSMFLGLGAIILAVASVAASLAGVSLVVRGLTAGLTAALDGRVWLAELGSGLLILAGTALAMVSVHALVERRMLRGLKERAGGKHAAR